MDPYLKQINILLDADPVVSSSDPSPENESETETSSSYDDYMVSQVKLNNNLLIGIIFFLGLIFGIIGVSIFFGRIGNGKDR